MSARAALANPYLSEFRADYNQRFAREPLNVHDAHRPLRDDDDLDLIFTWQEDRKLSRNLTFQYTRVMYIVEPAERVNNIETPASCI